jgi:hypothetical protein
MDMEPLIENQPHPGINNLQAKGKEYSTQDWFQLAQISPFCVGKAIEHLSQSHRYRRDGNLGLEAYHMDRAAHYLKAECARLRKGSN